MYKVRIEQFEGPFDLLVYLLENARMDIYDIRVSEITEQYINYLKEMGDLNVEIGSEFIVLAAVLIRLKSRMLLPRINSQGELVIEEDPRLELASKLAEYVRIKKVAEMLQQREEYYSYMHEKPAEDISRYLDSPEELLRTDSDQFVNAFLAFLEKRKKVTEVKRRYDKIKRQRASVEQRIKYMISVLDMKIAEKGYVSFTELIPEGSDRYDVTVSFMSLLEMIKMQEVDANQTETYGDITVRRKDKSQVIDINQAETYEDTTVGNEDKLQVAVKEE